MIRVKELIDFLSKANSTDYVLLNTDREGEIIGLKVIDQQCWDERMTEDLAWIDIPDDFGAAEEWEATHDD